MKKILYFVTFLFTLNTAIANDVIVENPIVRLMPLNVKTTAGYFELSNKSDVEETLIGAKSNSFKNRHPNYHGDSRGQLFHRIYET